MRSLQGTSLKALVSFLIVNATVGLADSSWQSTYSMPGFRNSEPLDACEGFGGGIIICGGCYNAGPTTDGRGFLMKIDQTIPSAPVFQVTFDPFNNGAYANSVRRLDGEDYYLIAGASNTKSKSSHPMLMLIDDNGNVVQSSEITSIYGYGIDAFVAEDGDYILSGETWVGPASRQCFIARVSGSEPDNVLWIWTYSERNEYYPMAGSEFWDSRIYSNCALEIPSSYGNPFSGSIVAGICRNAYFAFPIAGPNSRLIILDSEGTDLYDESWVEATGGG